MPNPAPPNPAPPNPAPEAALPDTVMVPLESPFEDARGVIQNLLEIPTGSTVLITSKSGSVRANHYHKTDWHYCYLISGSMEYFHRPTGGTGEAVRITVRAGEIVFTPPMVDHAMKFLEDTVFITMSRNARDHDSYEDDLVRVELI